MIHEKKILHIIHIHIILITEKNNRLQNNIVMIIIYKILYISLL
jgi:hypothetical protein